MPVSSKFPAESTGEKIVKIGQYLTKIWTKYDSLVFWGATLYIHYTVRCVQPIIYRLHGCCNSIIELVLTEGEGEREHQTRVLLRVCQWQRNRGRGGRQGGHAPPHFSKVPILAPSLFACEKRLYTVQISTLTNLGLIGYCSTHNCSVTICYIYTVQQKLNDICSHQPRFLAPLCA